MLLTVKDEDPRPLYKQLVEQLKRQILEGVLEPGEVLPSAKEVAASLGINAHTVRRAYVELQQAGLVVMGLGRRTRVAKEVGKPAKAEEVVKRLAGPLEELVSEARLLGLSKEEFLQMAKAAFEHLEGGSKQ